MSAAPLHLVKLCVGIQSVAHLRRVQREARNAPRHTTRMLPRRRAELLQGGSLYWVIAGVIRVRQRLVDVQPFTGHDGVRRCRLWLDPKLVPTRPHPRRPFQGWRYLEAAAAPEDLPAAGDGGSASLRTELAALGLL